MKVTLKYNFVMLAALSFGVLFFSSSVSAANLTVNSTADTTANDGVCTLREAITSANSDTASGATGGECIAGNGNDTINFNITGTADFTNGGQDGYTIKPQSALPNITETVTIDGYSQPGASQNTTVAPNPFDAVLLIELDGSEIGGFLRGFLLDTGSDDSVLKGLVINNFSDDDAIKLTAIRVTIQGNYIGTDPTGMIAKPNRAGINATSGGGDAEDALIGGLNPEDRNIISGNTAGTTAAGGYPSTGWTIQGNYVGIAADGITPIANSTIGGSGSFSVDNAEDVVIGGPEDGAINVIGVSLGHGLAPLNADNLRIEGNYIGLAYDGETVLDNPTGEGEGIALSDSENVLIKGNRIAGYSNGGFGVTRSSDVNLENNTIFKNPDGGISVQSSSNVTIGGIGKGNYVYDNIGSSGSATGGAQIVVLGFSPISGAVDNIVIQSNNIGFDKLGNTFSSGGTGIDITGDPSNILIGGVSASEGNIIKGSSGFGISVSELNAQAFSLSLAPLGVSIMSNSIYDTTVGGAETSGLGIDLLEKIDTSNPPDGIPESYANLGSTLNDPSDSDTGPNNFINFPVLNSVEQNGTTATINFNLDAADGEDDQYRVEFFSNDTQDPSGYGEGQTFLGATTVTNGNNQIANLVLPSSTDLAGKSISATTTAIDSSATHGFGSTSEFSKAITVPNESSSSITQAALADTGQSAKVAAFTSLGLITVSFIMFKSPLVEKRNSFIKFK